MILYNIRVKSTIKNTTRNTGITHIRRATLRIRRHWLRKSHMTKISREKTMSK